MNFNKKIHNGYLTGRLLLSSPANKYDILKKSCILICAHDTNGAMGLIINKKEGNIKLNDLLVQIEIPPVISNKNPPIYTGGPLDNTHGFILHDKTYNEESTATVSNLFNLTATTDVLEEISKGRGPENFKIALGYVGWKANQLENEIANNSWITLPADANTVFSSQNDTLWYSTLSKHGIDASKLSPQNGSA